MPEPRCLNCDTAFQASANFCANCGQRTDASRLTFRDILRDLMHTFVNVERGPLAFAWALLTRPGVVAREYVDGKRRRHYGPFATLAVLVGLTALAVNLTGFQILSHDGLPSTPTSLLQRHFNVLLLLQLPLLGGVCTFVFRRARMTLPEHMVLVAYTLSVRAVCLAVAVLVAFEQSASVASVGYFYAFWVAWYVYFGWAASQFYSGRRVWTWLGGAAAAGLEHVVIIAVLIAANSIYEAILTLARGSPS
jgi:hypothetical protein